MMRSLALALAVTAAAGMLTGCIADESAPNRRGVERPTLLQESQGARENAQKRTLERPQRELPTGGTDLPGQSRLDTPDQGVVTLASLGNEPAEPLPPLNDLKPYYTSRPHDLPVPGTDWVLESYVGSPVALESYPHRPWPKKEAYYQRAAVPQNPPYMAPLFFQAPVVDRCGCESGVVRALKDIADAPFFVAQGFTLPVLMVIRPPLSKTTLQFASGNPLYQGATPTTGAVVAVPVPGVIRWEYPFMKPQEERRKEAKNPPLPLLPGTEDENE